MYMNEIPFAPGENYYQHSVVVMRVLNQLKPDLFKFKDLVSTIHHFIFQDVQLESRHTPSNAPLPLHDIKQEIFNRFGQADLTEEELESLLQAIHGMRKSIAHNKLSAPDQLNSFLHHPTDNLFSQLRNWSRRYTAGPRAPQGH